MNENGRPAIFIHPLKTKMFKNNLFKIICF